LLAIGLPACSGPPLEIAPEELPPGAAGQYYEQVLTTGAGGTERWSVDAGSLPAGLSLSSSSGTLAGTPTEAGTFNFDVGARVTDLPPSSGQRNYTLTILPELEVTLTAAIARVGEAYSITPLATGGVPPYAYNVVGLPAGLTFDATTGTISGTPAWPYLALPIQVIVTDTGDPVQQVTLTRLLVIKPRNVSVTTTTLPTGHVNQPYAATLVAVDGQPPYTWSITAGYLGDVGGNLELNQSLGIIAGTPRTAGTITITVQVTDADNPPSVAAQSFTLTIEP
jgi:hypothetical protein